MLRPVPSKDLLPGEQPDRGGAGTGQRTQDRRRTVQEKYSCRVLALLPTGAPVLLSAVPPPTPMPPPPGTRAPSSPLSKPTSPRDCSPEELWVSSQLFDSRQPLNIEDIPVSPILLKSSLFNSEILLCQSPTLNFFFYCFDTYLFEMSLFPLVCLKPCHS